MKKLVFLLLIAVILPSVPWYIGNTLQKQLETHIAHLNEISGYRVKFSHYDRKLLNANAILNISLPESIEKQTDSTEKAITGFLQRGLQFNIDLTHGPLLLKPNATFGLSSLTITLSEDQEFVKSAKEELGLEQLFLGEFLMDLDGKGYARFSLPAMKDNNGIQEFSFGGLELQITLGNFGKKYNINGRTESTFFRDKNIRIESSPILLTGMGEADGSLWKLRNSILSMESFSLKGASLDLQTKGLYANLNLNSHAVNLLDIDYKLSLEQLGSNLLPGHFKNAVLDISLVNIPSSTLRKFYTRSAYIKKPEPQKTIELHSLTSELLSKSPKLVLEKIAFEFAESTFLDVQGDIKINSDVVGDTSATTANPFILLPAIESELVANFSEDLILMASQQYMSNQMHAAGVRPEEITAMKEDQALQRSLMTEKLLHTGFLLRTDRGFKVVASFNKGEFQVNGKPMPLPL